MNDYFVLLLGVTFAGIGGELFVRGAVGLAHWWRIAPGIIGATVAAFATSSPELSVSVNSALSGKPEIALGDALGSNVVNVALILAIALLIAPIRSSQDSIKRDFPVAILVPILTGILFIDGTLSRMDGLLMLGAFIAWLTITVMDVRKNRSAATEVLAATRHWRITFSCISGLLLLLAAGKLIVLGATSLAISFGIAEFVVGATIVALGTSVPELATAIIARWRGHDEIGIGTILGSNIFNGLFIVSIAAMIHPVTVNPGDIALTLLAGLVAIAISFPGKSGLLERRRGALLLVLYIFYVASLFEA